MSLRSLVGGYESRYGRSLAVRRFANHLLAGMKEEELKKMNLCEVAATKAKSGEQSHASKIREYITYFGNADIDKMCQKQIVMDAGTPFEEIEQHKYSALGWAVYYNHADNVEMLLKCKADPNVLTHVMDEDDDEFDSDPLIIMGLQKTSEILPLLLRAKADPNIGSQGYHINETPLGQTIVRAQHDGNLDPVYHLLRAKADVNALHNFNTPLHISAGPQGYGANMGVPVTRALLEYKADPSLAGQDGPPILDARPETLRMLLQAKADPNAMHRGLTPLVAALQKDRPTNVRLLLEAKADPSGVGKQLVSALARSGHPRFVPLLEDAEPAEKRKRV